MALLLIGACTPIGRTGGDPAPLRPPDPLPALEIITVDGRVTSLADLHEGPLVMTFLRPYPDRRSGLARELMALIANARALLRTDVAARTTFLVFLLDDPGPAALPAWLPTARDWEIAVGPQESIRSFAGQLGVLLWPGTEDLPGQSFVTAVVDADGILRHRLLGLEDWSARDLVGSIVDAD